MKFGGQMTVDTALAATADVLEEKTSMMPQPSYGSRTVSKGYPTSSTNRSTGKFYRVCL